MKVIVLFTPTTTVNVEGWKFRDWSLPTFSGMITVTPVLLDEFDPERDTELDAEPLVDEFVPVTIPVAVPLVLELEPDEVMEVVVEFGKARLELVDELLIPMVLLLRLIALLVVLLHADEGIENVVADVELKADETIEVELVVLLTVALLALGAMLVDVLMPVLLLDELEPVEEVVVVIDELAWAGDGLRPATAPLPDELLLVLDIVPIPEEDGDALFVALVLFVPLALPVAPVLFVALVEKPELVEELELITRDELLVDSSGDEEVVQVVFEIIMLELLELELMVGMDVEIDELVPMMPLVLLTLDVEGVEGARVARYTALPAIMMMTIIIAAPAVVEMALESLVILWSNFIFAIFLGFSLADRLYGDRAMGLYHFSRRKPVTWM